MLLLTACSIGTNWCVPAAVLLNSAATMMWRRVVDCRLRVVAGIEASTSTLHDAAVRVGEVVLRLRLGHAELALVAPALEVAIFVAGLAIVALATPALDADIAALLQTLAGLGDGLQAGLAPLDLGRYVQLGLVGLGRVGALRAFVEQSVNLRLEFGQGERRVGLVLRVGQAIPTLTSSRLASL